MFRRSAPVPREVPDGVIPVVTNEKAETTNAIAKLQTHTVAAGETLGAIAELYQVDVDTLLSANPDIGETIHPGEQLLILPRKGLLHTVDVGDTLWRIAHLYNVEIAAIIDANAKQNEQLAIGEKLFIPDGKRPSRSSDIPVSRGNITRFIWPTQGELSSPFGYRWGRLHAGIDIANDIGTSVRVAMAGRVSYVGWYGGYGYVVMVEHGQGYDTLYGHLSDYVVAKGQHVQTGQLIAHIGNTGDSTGPHLHFEVHKDGQPINPVGLLP
jgi:murein DD-endopeptidase MepM/ murein hydrolase activator NlpD